MLCDECGKNPASIHIVQITTEGKSARNLCQRCAAKLGADVSSLDNIGGLEGNFTVNDFLRGVFGGSHSRKIESKDSLENEENLSEKEPVLTDSEKAFSISSIGENRDPSGNQPAEQSPSMQCSRCGLTLQEFANAGKLGCDNCYDTFKKYLMPVLKRIHGAGSHSGKIPARSGGKLAVKRQLESLRIKLKEAVAAEEYEKAAEYRDMIRAMEQDNGEV